MHKALLTVVINTNRIIFVNVDRQFLRRLRRDILDFPSTIRWDAECFSTRNDDISSNDDNDDGTTISGTQSDDDPSNDDDKRKRHKRNDIESRFVYEQWRTSSRSLKKRGENQSDESVASNISRRRNRKKFNSNVQLNPPLNQQGRRKVDSVNGKTDRTTKFCNFHIRRWIKWYTKLKVQKRCERCCCFTKNDWWAKPALAAEGNFFEAVNMTLDHFSVHHVDRSLAQTGQNERRDSVN